MSLLIKPIAVILVARGQGLIAVIKPSSNAVSHGIVLLSNRFVRNSIQLFDQQTINFFVDNLFEFFRFGNSIHETFVGKIDFLIALY